ncbi:hypothetical protein PLICRDRAFT_100818 [Plicaturopsis crispa FD-325 SS-3]|nr:hypothetical protein PLICRDRAFT_100818 [Plicaturopsis crispa FD-325 SS-3]
MHGGTSPPPQTSHTLSSATLESSDETTRANRHVRSDPSDVQQAEQLGLEHARAIAAQCERLYQILLDDWELENDDDGYNGGEEEGYGDHEDWPGVQHGDTASTDPSTAAAGSAAPSAPRAPSTDGEDTDAPDPFAYAPEPTRPPPAAADVHPNRAVYMIYILVFWLHTVFHLPFRACNAILIAMDCIFLSAGLKFEPAIITTLPSVISRLNAEPHFKICPVCPSCSEVYPSTVDRATSCTKCQHPLFPSTPTPSQQRHGHAARENPKPYIQFPMKSLGEQMATMLAVPGIEDEVDSYRQQRRVDGKYNNIFDGRVCKELRGVDGKSFFFGDESDMEEGELRIGVLMGVDWFSYLRSQIAPSHTSCPMSYSVINLSPHHRYRTVNLLLSGIMPGPKEANPDEVQKFLHIFINELLRLYKEGVVVVTPRYPNGRLVRIVLVGLVCDKPAAHKLGGFGSHSHRCFCTRCWIEQAEKATSESFKKNGFRERTDAEQRRLGEEYLRCMTNADKAKFVKEFATRWSELSRLPYFDLCRMIVIDPMHNLFLGKYLSVVKTHFYHIWVQQKVLRKTKELRRLHAILAQLDMPAKLGRLPSLIGEPAGGSLTADQWLVFATVVAPIAIPQVWQDYHAEEPSSVIDRRTKAIAASIQEKRDAAAAARRETAERRRREEDAPPTTSTRRSGRLHSDDEEYDNRPAPTAGRKRRRRRANDPDVADNGEEDDGTAPCNLHRDDPAHFLKLCTALKILVSRSIDEDSLNKADLLLREYTSDLVKLYGPSVIRPNHHYATHTPECVRDYGPLHEFWTFLFERINKVLKSYKTNNHSGGELETTFFREFHRTLAQGFDTADNTELARMVGAMYRASADDRGTVQALARESDEAQEDEGISFLLSTHSQKLRLPDTLYYKLLQHFRSRRPDLQIHSHIVQAPHPQSQPLLSHAIFFDYVVVNHHRYRAASRASAVSDSFVGVRMGDHPGAPFWVGILRDIFVIEQPAVGLHRYGYVEWLRPLALDLSGTVWDELYVQSFTSLLFQSLTTISY